MEVIVVILIIGFAIANSVSKAKRLNQTRPGQGRKPQPQARPQSAPRPTPAPAEPGPGRGQLPTLDELMEAFLGKEDAPEAVAHEGAEAVSYEDEKGCVGGSLPHDPGELHEGESTTTELPRLEFKHPDTSADYAPRRRGMLVDAEEMRRAVVMAEILGKPKALKSRALR